MLDYGKHQSNFVYNLETNRFTIVYRLYCNFPFVADIMRLVITEAEILVSTYSS
jgi:hypothetical protein